MGGSPASWESPPCSRACWHWPRCWPRCSEPPDRHPAPCDIRLNAELIVPMAALRPPPIRRAAASPYSNRPARNSRNRFITFRLARVASSTRANTAISTAASRAWPASASALPRSPASSPRFSAWHESASSSSRSASRRASAREASTTSSFSSGCLVVTTPASTLSFRPATTSRAPSLRPKRYACPRSSAAAFGLASTRLPMHGPAAQHCVHYLGSHRRRRNVVGSRRQRGLNRRHLVRAHASIPRPSAKPRFPRC